MCSAITGRTLCSPGHESMRRVKVLAECHKSAWHLLPRTPSARVVRSVAPHKPYIIFIVLIAATCVFWQLTAAGRQKEPLRCICQWKDVLLKAEDERECKKFGRLNVGAYGRGEVKSNFFWPLLQRSVSHVSSRC